MAPRVNHVRWLCDYRLELGFTDSLRAHVDFRDRIAGRGGVFRPLADVEFFKQVRVEPDAGTIVWPNGVDFCPDVLYGMVRDKSVEIGCAQ